MLYDITPIVSARLAVWPGDTPPSREVLLDMKRGDNLTLSTLRGTVHLGAHADAPSHYGRDAASIEARDLSLYLGPCQVVHVTVGRGARIPVSAIPEPLLAPRVLFGTGRRRRESEGRGMTVLARLGRRLNSAGFVTFERLKWATIVLPSVALLVLLALLRSHLHDWLHEPPGVFFLVGLFAVCVFSFASIVFALVEAQEARVLAQNRMLADLLERTERQNVELSALLSVSRASASSVEPTSMYDEALGAILAATAAETVELWLADAGFLSVAATKGTDVSPKERTRLRFGDGLAGEAASRGSVVVVRSSGDNHGFGFLRKPISGCVRC